MKQSPTKKKATLKKLSLHKETIVVLNNGKMNGVKGGLTATCSGYSCCQVNCKYTW